MKDETKKALNAIGATNVKESENPEYVINALFILHPSAFILRT